MPEEPKRAGSAAREGSRAGRSGPVEAGPDVGSESGPDAQSGGLSVALIRSRAAQVVWLGCVVLATFLALGALCVALEANEDNALVSFVLGMADRVDLGIFSQSGGVKEFSGESAEVKNALFNWGLGAVFWLVAGRVLERVIRP